MKIRACAILMACLLSAATAKAQNLPTGITGTIDPLQPRWEIGVGLAGWLGPDGRGGWGLRTGRNFTDWFGVEVGIGARTDRPERHATLEVKARFLAPPIPGRVGQVYASAGVIRAAGLSYDTSPIVGLGIQSRWDDLPFSLRGEAQLATRGDHVLHDRLRLMIGLSVAIKRD